MGRHIIEVVQVLADRIYDCGYQQRSREDDIYEQSQRRIAAEKDRDHWKQARQEAHEAGELMQAELEELRKRRAAVQVILDKIWLLSEVNIGDAEACIDAVCQIRKYFNGNDYPFMKGGE